MRPRKTVVLVDDNEHVLSVRGMVMETWGYRVLRCGSAAEALQWMRDGKVLIDLLVTDLVMPEMSGDELVRRAKQMRPLLPTLIVSGQIANFDRATHADWFMPKGAGSPAELRERVRIMCARKRGPIKKAVKAATAEGLRLAAAAEVA